MRAREAREKTILARQAVSMAELQREREARAAMDATVVADAEDWIKGLDERIDYAAGQGRTNIIVSFERNDHSQALADKLMLYYRELGYSTSWTSVTSEAAVPLHHGLVDVEEVVLTIIWGGDS